ncbi:mRNA 3' end processing factor [Conoideocrella luteorostrata]|uniref:mRNA 3' end processing factor n=1 Tax=Conoideocrella luteorostrata TaxID=1105319 RepID=A0AAJ0FMW8_9HYPO|nr:mRNA 3' end processing factor [Conoideocrella luteorostrata]
MASEADEVAEDYRHALEDLSSNMRFEISNLTVIARENTEHALAIAEVLQQHILKAPPSKKLPSLYVLDSIVKNVGTPYTLYFGRNLFKTFMESYAVVDNNVRKKMEEMLKTWKDPVPGSMDTRPVFSHELVRPIENALMKARAATMPQQGPLPGRPRSAMMPHRNTPTPPGMRGVGGPTGAYPQPQYTHVNGGRPVEPVAYPGQLQFTPNSSTPQPHVSTPSIFQPPLNGPYGSLGAATSVGISVETLSNDIQDLIIAMKAEFTQNPHDASIQNRLRALLDLQGVLQRTSLPPDQLELIKNKVTELAAVTRKVPSSQNSTPVPGYGPPHSASVAPTPAPAQEQKPQVTLDSLLGPGAMAALMARQAAASQGATMTPPPPFAGAPIRSPPPVQTEASKPPPQNPLALLDQLRQAGMLSSTTPTHSSNPAAAPPPTLPQSILPPNISSVLASAKAAAAARQGFGGNTSSVLNEAALKQQYCPDAIAALYDNLGPPCTQCGRRFKTDEEGKRKKMAHMDWHFRVHQRTTEAEKRGTHRSWYVDHQDWLRSREVVDSDHIAEPEDAVGQASEAEKGPKYIPVPDPSSGINNICPICQEKFENKWLDTAQEWVWLDAVLVGNRAFHASCHAEATRDREGTPGVSRRTPEPVLGKRKADTTISSPKIRALKTLV